MVNLTFKPRLVSSSNCSVYLCYAEVAFNSPPFPPLRSLTHRIRYLESLDTAQGTGRYSPHLTALLPSFQWLFSTHAVAFHSLLNPTPPAPGPPWCCSGRRFLRAVHQLHPPGCSPGLPGETPSHRPVRTCELGLNKPISCQSEVQFSTPAVVGSCSLEGALRKPPGQRTGCGGTPTKHGWQN